MKLKQHKSDCIWLGCSGHKGGSRISNEHVFSTWMHDLVDHPQQNWHINQRGVPNRRPLLENRRRPGLTIHRTLKVCKNCNETWMKAIEDDAIPVLTPLILGHDVRVPLDGQKKLARWLTLKAITAEFDDRPNMAVSSAERSAFFSSPDPLPGWQLFLGYYEGEDWKSRYHHNGYYVSPGGIRLPPGKRILNCQLTILSYGSVFTVSVSNLPAQFTGWEEVMDRIWPARNGDIVFPRAKITDRMADEIMSTLSDFAQQRNRDKHAERPRGFFS